MFPVLLVFIAVVGLVSGAPLWASGAIFIATGLAWAVTHRAVTRRVAGLETANRAQSQVIASQRARLEAAVADEAAFAREIHHRVRNNLQIIGSLVNMRQRVLVDPLAQAVLNDLHDRIAALALIHRTLDKGPGVDKVDMRDFLANLVDDQIVGQDGLQPRVTAVVSAEPLMIDADRLAPLALFVVEAISNVRKHALKRGESLVRVDLSMVGSSAVLSIVDEGLVDPPDLSRAGPGRVLMAGFARQLKGCLEVEVNEGGGVTVRLTFPADTPNPGESA